MAEHYERVPWVLLWSEPGRRPVLGSSLTGRVQERSLGDRGGAREPPDALTGGGTSARASPVAGRTHNNKRRGQRR